MVTQIEFFSHTNKRLKKGRKLYVKKREELREAGVNIVEIDLLRRGPSIIDLPGVALKRLQPWDYLVNVIRAGSDDYEVYQMPLRQRLSRPRIPLRAGATDVVLDLQNALDHTYDTGPYPDRIDYDAEPEPPLRPEDAAWADAILRQAGLRR